MRQRRVELPKCSKRAKRIVKESVEYRNCLGQGVSSQNPGTIHFSKLWWIYSFFSSLCSTLQALICNSSLASSCLSLYWFIYPRLSFFTLFSPSRSHSALHVSNMWIFTWELGNYLIFTIFLGVHNSSQILHFFLHDCETWWIAAKKERERWLTLIIPF